MKNLTLVILLAMPFRMSAQSVFTNQTNTALQQVIGDYPNHFRNIKGAVVNEDPQSTDFESKVAIPGASQTVVTKYSSTGEKEIYSWKCTMGQAEEFDSAAVQYKQLYSEIKNSIVKIEGEKPFILTGSYETPTDEKRFMASTFSLLPSTGGLSKLKVVLALEYFVTEWKITLSVYDQEEAVVME